MSQTNTVLIFAEELHRKIGGGTDHGDPFFSLSLFLSFSLFFSFSFKPQPPFGRESLNL
jgi:hypothetical protein